MTTTEETATIAIQSIEFGKRVRKDMGDLQSLADSIKRHGLLHPIVVLSDNTLVAGARRVEAALLLGWSEIPARVVNVADLLSAERDENSERKDFTPTEAVAIGKLIETEHHKAIQESRSALAKKATATRQAKRLGIAVPKQHADVAAAGKTRAVVGKAIGMSGYSYDMAKEVVAAAEADPATFGDLPAAMDESRNVSGAHRELVRRGGAKSRSKHKPRHPIHANSPRPNPTKSIARAVQILDGICFGLQDMEPGSEPIDKAQAAEWAKSLIKSARTISAFARRLQDGKF